MSDISIYTDGSPVEDWEVETDNKQVIGQAGENLVADSLEELGDGYVIFNNIVIEDRFNNETQIDHLVVSKSGIFVIETKNWAGEIKGTRNSFKWMQVINGKEYISNNPINQNSYHISILKNILHNILSSKLKYYSIITFTGEAVPPDIEQTDFRFISKENIVEYIKSIPNEISERYVDAVVEMVQYSIITKEYNQD